MSQQPAPYPPQRETSGQAIAALIFGILGFVAGCLPLGIVAIFLGHGALNQIRRHPGAFEGEALAKAGLILGWIQVALMAIGVGIALLMLLVAVGAAAA